MNTVIEFLFPTAEAGLVWGLFLIIAGILVHQYAALEVGDRRDIRAQKLEAAQDQAIRIVTVDPDPVELLVWSGEEIPSQRLTNGEDLLGGAR